MGTRDQTRRHLCTRFGVWLNHLHSITSRANAISSQEESENRPCLAIWGPSQTGKSTLLAEYIDAKGDEVGNDTALQWSSNEPVRFVGDIKGGEVTVLNPFNKGADASGCVTRFVMRDSVPDPEHPVKVTFASEAQIMHALAVGYLSETEATTSEDQQLSLDQEGIEKIIGEFKETGLPDREAFELLVEVADTIGLLIKSSLPRYTNLQRDWERSLRRSILESKGLLSSVDNVRSFAYQVFWDSWPSITSAFEKLRQKLSDIRDRFGDREIRCSYPLAALLLNISATELYGRSEIVRSLVDDAACEAGSEVVNIGSASGQRLFSGSNDFCLFQGLVWQLEVSLRSDVIRSTSPAVHSLLSTADLLDFPGVANEFKSSDPYTDTVLEQDPELIYTRFSSEGKTASIVVTSANNLDIDGFSILMRMNRYPSHPVQLQTGIQCWFESFGKEWPPRGGQSLPLNLVLTFTASLVNEVAASGIGHGLEPVFDKMQGLGYLSDPGVVTTFATNYPQFPDGKFQAESADLSKIVEEIVADRAFQRQFPTTGESLRAMAENGGKEYFFEHLITQAKQSIRPALIASHREKLISSMRELLGRTLPGEADAQAQRSMDIDSCIQSIQNFLKNSRSPDPARELGLVVQDVVNIEPETLDQLPRNAIRNQRRSPIRPFLEKQFNDWREDKVSKGNGRILAGGDDPLLSRLLIYFSENVCLDELQKWTLENLGNIKSGSEANRSRRFLATKMNNLLLFETGKLDHMRHPSVDSVQEMIQKLAAAEFSPERNVEHSPHYLSVIKPFIERLEELKTAQSSERGDQPGDMELVNLIN